MSANTCRNLFYFSGFVFLALLSVVAVLYLISLFLVYFPHHNHVLIEANRLIPNTSVQDFKRTDFITIVLSALGVIFTTVTLTIAALGFWGFNSLQKRKEEFDKEVRVVRAEAIEGAKKTAREEAKNEARRVAPEVARDEAQNTAAIFAIAANNGRKTPKHFGD